MYFSCSVADDKEELFGDTLWSVLPYSPYAGEIYTTQAAFKVTCILLNLVLNFQFEGWFKATVMKRWPRTITPHDTTEWTPVDIYCALNTHVVCRGIWGLSSLFKE